MSCSSPGSGRFGESGLFASARNLLTPGSLSHGATAWTACIEARTQQSSMSPMPGQVVWLNTWKICGLMESSSSRVTSCDTGFGAPRPSGKSLLGEVRDGAQGEAAAPEAIDHRLERVERFVAAQVHEHDRAGRRTVDDLEGHRAGGGAALADRLPVDRVDVPVDVLRPADLGCPRPDG